MICARPCVTVTLRGNLNSFDREIILQKMFRHSQNIKGKEIS